MESVEHQTTVHVKLDGRDPTATFVFLYQVVIMELATMHLTATVKLAGKEHSVTSPAVKTAPMDSVSLLMNVSVQTDGPVRIVMLANLALDVNTEPAENTLSPVSVNLAGRDFSVMNLPVVWIATMDFATHLVKQIQPTFAYVILDGKDRAVTLAHLTGNVPIRMPMLVTIPMNVSASTMKLMLWVFATTQP